MKKIIGIIMIILMAGLVSGQECIRTSSTISEETGMYEEEYNCGEITIEIEGTHEEIRETIITEGFTMVDEESIMQEKEAQVKELRKDTPQKVIEKEESIWDVILDIIIFWR